MYIKRFDKNTVGKDWITGDLHGHFHLLETKLREIGFNFATDRLFTPGDLINRGPFSNQVLHYISQPWFHASLGNHEHLAIQFAAGQYSEAELAKCGGQWLVNLTWDKRMAYAEKLQMLPMAMEVETEYGMIGLVHAEVMRDDWQYFKQCVSEIKTQRDFQRIATPALWERERIKTYRQNLVAGILHVYVGHSPQNNVITLGNVSYIDSGLYKGNDIRILPITHFVDHLNDSRI